MSRVIVTEFLTLDGVMEEPTPWQRGHASPEIGRFKRDELFESGALLLGRVTYEGFGEDWPTDTGSGDFGERMNSLPKYVATTTLRSLAWNATALAGEVAPAVAALKRKAGKNLLVYGSGALARTPPRHGLVDELRLMVYLLVLGRGRRLFSGEDRPALKLGAVKDLGAGVVLLICGPTTEACARSGWSWGG